MKNASTFKVDKEFRFYFIISVLSKNMTFFVFLVEERGKKKCAKLWRVFFNSARSEYTLVNAGHQCWQFALSLSFISRFLCIHMASGTASCHVQWAASSISVRRCESAESLARLVSPFQQYIAVVVW